MCEPKYICIVSVKDQPTSEWFTSRVDRTLAYFLREPYVL